MNRASRTTRAVGVSVALMGLAVALPLGVMGAVGGLGMVGMVGQPTVVARTCEALAAREHRALGIGHTLTHAARQFCGQHAAPVAAISPRVEFDPCNLIVITQPWPTLSAAVKSLVHPAFTDLPPPSDC